MRSPLSAMAWIFWGRHWRGLVAVAACALGLAVLFHLLPAGTLRHEHGVAVSVPIVFGLAYLATVFCCGFESHLEVRESGFPAWMFTLPVRTGLLVGWPMLQGMAAVAALGAVWVNFVLPPCGWEGPAWLPALLAVSLAVVQALVWSPFPLPWARVVVAVGVLSGLVMFSPLLEPFHGLSHRVFIGALVCLLPAAYGVAVVGVSRSRRGEASSWTWPRWTAASPVSRSWCRRPFSSPVRAQLWFEWRRHGVTFPVIVGCFSVLFLGLLWLEDSADGRARLGLALVLFPLVFAPLTGTSLGGGPGPASRDPFQLSSFIATRPLSTAGLAASTFKAAVLSALAGWTLLLPAALVWSSVTGFHRAFGAWWEQQLQDGNAVRAGVLVLLVFAAPVLLTVSGMVGNLFIGFTGRRWVVFGSYFVAAALLIPALWGVSWLLNHPERHEQFREALPSWLGGAVLAKLLLAGGASLALWRRGLVPGRTLGMLLGCWVLVAASLSALLGWVAPEGLAPMRLLVPGVILALPLARLTLTPLALSWNRHR